MKFINDHPYLLIDPFERTIRAVAYDGSLDVLYALLDCATVDVARGHKFDLYVDDEGLFKADQQYFAIIGELGQPIAGKALVIGKPDHDGNTTPPSVSREYIDRNILWVSAVEWADEDEEDDEE